MIKVSTGLYVEVKSAEIEYDGDYLMGTLKVRVVSNGQDNVHTTNYPGCYGDFVQKVPSEEVLKELVPKMKEEMLGELKRVYKFEDATLKNLMFKYILPAASSALQSKN